MKTIFLLLLLLFSTLQGSFLHVNNLSTHSVYNSISYFEDKDGGKSLAEIQKVSFTPYTQERSINFGFTKSVYWFKIDLGNLILDHTHKWWMKIDYPLLENVDLYLLDSNGTVVKHKKMGTSQPFESREVTSHHFISEIPIGTVDEARVLLRVQTQSSIQLPITILSSEELFSEIEQNNFYVGIYYGLFIIILLYNIVLFIYTNDRNYLRYILFLVSFIVWQLSFDGLGIKYIWGDNRWMIEFGSSTFIVLSSFFALYFSRHFLDTPRYTPKTDKAIGVMMGITFSMSVVSIVLPYGMVIPINAALVSIVPIILLIAGFGVMRHEYHAARFYVAGWSSFLIATIIFSFNKFDLLPSFYGVNHVQQIGSAVEMIFLSLALAHRVYLLQDEYIGKLNRLNETLSDKVKVALKEARMKDRLFVQQSRLAAMGEMIEQIAHQWRQPLNTLALLNQDMYVKQKLGQCDDHYFEKNHTQIDEYLQYLSKTIDDFRNFYKTDKSKTLEDIGELAINALNLSDVFLKYAKIKTDLKVDSKRKVHIAKNEMIQVFMNLLKNAHDAIVERKIKNGKIAIAVQDDDFGIRIEVADNAGGISADIMEKIFDIYFTTKDPDKGTGLGLHMSKYIIEESFGGQIWVENRDSGACFSILLPI